MDVGVQWLDIGLLEEPEHFFQRGQFIITTALA